ncbi:MAG TPA: hypothetical protein V6D17_19810 [Candidatus Obscuribacterales bacterium]
MDDRSEQTSKLALHTQEATSPIWVNVIAGAAIIGLIVVVYLEFFGNGTLSGRVDLRRVLGAKPITQGVEVLLIPEQPLLDYIRSKESDVASIRAKLKEQELSALRESQTATGRSSNVLGVASDVVFNAMTLGVYSLARQGHDRKMALWAAQDAHWKQQVWPVAGYYFKSLPKAIAKTRTADDGSYSLSVPRKGQYAIAAHLVMKSLSKDLDPKDPDYAQKSYQFVPPKRQRYWLLWVNMNGAKQQKLDLTDDNLTESRDPANVLQASCYDWWEKK